MEAPKRSALEAGVAPVGVPDDDGVFTTAVFPSQETPAPQPVQQPNLDPSVLEPTQEDLIQQRLQERFESVAPEVGVGEFTPSTLLEQRQLEQGTSSAVRRQGFSEGLLGAMFDYDHLSPAERIQLETEATNYAGRNPYWAMANGMAGRFASDLPAEVMIALTTGGLGTAASTIARTGRYGMSAQRIAKNIDKLRNLSANGTLGTKVSLNAGQDALEGFAGGMLSEGIRQELGRGTSFEDAVQAGLNDAALAPAFGFLFRSAAKLSGKAADKFRDSFADKIANDIIEDVAPQGQYIRTVEDEAAQNVANQIVEKLGGNAKADVKRQIIDSINNPLPERLARGGEAARVLDTPVVRAEYKAAKDKAGYQKFVEKYLHPDDRHLAVDIVDMVEARAKAAGLRFEQYADAKGLSFMTGKGEPSTLMIDGHNVIKAAEGKLRAGDLLHEIGHTMRSDLEMTKSWKKLKPAVEKHYGVKNGVWTRQAEERYAKDFVRSLARVAGAKGRADKFQDGDITLPAKVVESFKRAAEWLWGVYEKMIRRGVPNETLQLVGELFRRDGNAKVIVEQEKLVEEIKARELEVQAGREAQGITELFASGKNEQSLKTLGMSDPKSSPEPISESVEAAQNRQLEFQQKIKDGDIDTGTAIPKSDLGRKALKAKNKSPFISWQNGTLNMMLRQLGEVGKEITRMGFAAFNKSGQMAVLMNNTYSKMIKGASEEALSKLKDKKKVTLDTVIRNSDDTLTRGVKKEVELSGFERLKLTAYAMDGIRADGKAGRTQHSAGDALIQAGRNAEEGKAEVKAGGIRINGKEYILSREQRDAIANGELLSAPEKKMLDAIQATYRVIVPVANRLTQDIAGRDVFDSNNVNFTIKTTKVSDEYFNEMSSGFDSMFDTRGIDYTPFMERTGQGTLVLTNPFDELYMYIDRMSHALGHLEYNKSLDTLLQHGGQELREKMGRAYFDNLSTLRDISKGDKKSLGKGDPFFNTLYAIRQLGILAGNISASAKQVGSGFSAAATGLLTHNGAEITKNIIYYMTNGRARREAIEEMKTRVPSFAYRELKRNRMFDVDEIGSGNSQMLMGRELSIKDLLRMAATRKMKISDVAIELLERGLFMIKFMDHATMASVWRASKDTIEAGKGGDRSVEDLFTQVMMDSQPTRTPTTASYNQMHRGFGYRLFTQFSTQTRKNSELADMDITTYINKPPEERTAEAKGELFSTLVPLVIQSAYVAGAGLGANYTTRELTSVFASDKAERRRERMARKESRNQSNASWIFQNVMSPIFRTGVTQIPVSGAMIDALFAGATGGNVYDSKAPIIGEIIEIGKGLSDDDIIKIQKNIGILSGIPSFANKSVSEMLTNLK